ncbi:MAG: DNA-directed RNA polymerase subunit alpha [Campylobacteraceae bacterium 4484_4]|nr:MAG: DNA-directed RNA polymerase subunit alpha [Campylobacteraceae bacterium 4484_4]
MKKISTSLYMPHEIEIEKVSENSVKVYAYPFQSGFAVTVAHPLRRLLYGSSAGYAVTAVKIDGVSHEFDSIRGMLEDVALFILNLKNIRFKIKNESNKVEVSYSFSGHKEIKGSDLENDQVTVVTPEQHLATINEDAELNFSLIIEKGIGYVPSEQFRDDVPEEYIAVDAYFTPVRRAVYEIENVLVEDDPTFEKIVFEIETDGQIPPVQAFKESIEALNSQIAIFSKAMDINVVSIKDDFENSADMKKLLQSVNDLQLSARSFNCLDRANIKYVGELSTMSEMELKGLKNLGKKSFEEITGKLEALGFPVGSQFDEDFLKALNKKIEELKSQTSEA